MKKEPLQLSRWIASIAVFLNIGLNYYTNANPLNGKTIGEVSDQYPTLFTPAGYAFSIWGIIYLGLIIYSIVQLLPSQRKYRVYDRLAMPLLATSLLSIAWVVSFSYEAVTISEAIIVAMLITSLVLFVRSKGDTDETSSVKWIRVPFSLYAGWLSVATIASTATWLYSLNGGVVHLGKRPGRLL